MVKARGSEERNKRMAEIKAIQTNWNGHRFRSRIEARYAVFFEALGIPFEYEKEGYVLSDGSTYLPDFWLPSLNIWLEVKGAFPSETEVRKCAMLAEGIKQEVALAYGPVGEPSESSGVLVFDPEAIRDNGTSFDSLFDGAGGGGYWWARCWKCGDTSLVLENLVHFSRCHCLTACVCVIHPVTGKPWETQAIMPPDRDVLAAYAKARTARFEHGEKPTTQSKKGRRS